MSRAVFGKSNGTHQTKSNMTPETKKAIEQTAEERYLKTIHKGTISKNANLLADEQQKCFIAGATLYASKVEELEKENERLKMRIRNLENDGYSEFNH